MIEKKKKPYVICHLIASLDGRISGGSFKFEETIQAMKDHWPIRDGYECEAVLNGSVTAAEIYADGFLEEGEPAEAGEDVSREDYVAETDLYHYVVCLDPDGRLKWNGNVVDRPVQPRSHVIEALTEAAPEKYLEYLRARGISYVFAGRKEMDIPLLMEKLAGLFGIRRVLITGGGLTDWMMVEAGVVDEVSVIIAPAISGDRNSASLFDRPEGAREEKGFGLELMEARPLDHGGVLLRYRTRSGE